MTSKRKKAEEPKDAPDTTPERPHETAVEEPASKLERTCPVCGNKAPSDGRPCPVDGNILKGSDNV